MSILSAALGVFSQQPAHKPTFAFGTFWLLSPAIPPTRGWFCNRSRATDRHGLDTNNRSHPANSASLAVHRPCHSVGATRAKTPIRGEFAWPMQFLVFASSRETSKSTVGPDFPAPRQVHRERRLDARLLQVYRACENRAVPTLHALMFQDLPERQRWAVRHRTPLESSRFPRRFPVLH